MRCHKTGIFCVFDPKLRSCNFVIKIGESHSFVSRLYKLLPRNKLLSINPKHLSLSEGADL
jgi:hypothetical protein